METKSGLPHGDLSKFEHIPTLISKGYKQPKCDKQDLHPAVTKTPKNRAVKNPPPSIQERQRPNEQRRQEISRERRLNGRIHAINTRDTDQKSGHRTNTKYMVSQFDLISTKQLQILKLLPLRNTACSTSVSLALKRRITVGSFEL